MDFRKLAQLLEWGNNNWFYIFLTWNSYHKVQKWEHIFVNSSCTIITDKSYPRNQRGIDNPKPISNAFKHIHCISVITYKTLRFLSPCLAPLCGRFSRNAKTLLIVNPSLGQREDLDWKGPRWAQKLLEYPIKGCWSVLSYSNVVNFYCWVRQYTLLCVTLSLHRKRVPTICFCELGVVLTWVQNYKRKVGREKKWLGCLPFQTKIPT